MKPPIIIPQAILKSVKADLIKSTVDVTIRFSLNAEAIALRERLATLGVMEEPVKVEISQLAQQLEFKTEFEKAAKGIFEGRAVDIDAATGTVTVGETVPA